MKLLIILILGAIILYHLFKWSMRLFLPRILKRMVTKMQDAQRESFTQYQQRPHSQNRTDADVRIYKPVKPQNDRGYDVGGDYVDFEEVKE